MDFHERKMVTPFTPSVILVIERKHPPFSLWVLHHKNTASINRSTKLLGKNFHNSFCQKDKNILFFHSSNKDLSISKIEVKLQKAKKKKKAIKISCSKKKCFQPRKEKYSQLRPHQDIKVK